MRSKCITALLALMLLFSFGIPTANALLDELGLGDGEEPTKEEQRAEVRTMVKDTLAKLYEVQPSAKQAIDRSAGYAVFSNFGMKLGFVGSGRGEGIAHYKKTGKEIFMKMFEAQAGLGLGGKTFSQIFVFATEEPLNTFVNSGWTLGGQTTAAAKSGEMGESIEQAIAVAPGVWLYQLTGTGLAAEMTAKGTKYYKNDDLN